MIGSAIWIARVEGGGGWTAEVPAHGCLGGRDRGSILSPSLDSTEHMCFERECLKVCISPVFFLHTDALHTSRCPMSALRVSGLIQTFELPLSTFHPIEHHQPRHRVASAAAIPAIGAVPVAAQAATQLTAPGTATHSDTGRHSWKTTCGWAAALVHPVQLPRLARSRHTRPGKCQRQAALPRAKSDPAALRCVVQRVPMQPRQITPFER